MLIPPEKRMQCLKRAKAGHTVISCCRCRFTYTEDANYCPHPPPPHPPQSVKGLAGSYAERTCWELLDNTTDNQIIRLDVGIGCYILSANDQIILNFIKHYSISSHWTSRWGTGIIDYMTIVN